VRSVNALRLPPVQFVPGAGLNLAWREWNAAAHGVPVVLLHGITGSSADWHRTASHIEGRRVVALDARGHGQSDWDPAEAYSVDMHFADVATALDGLEIGRCIVGGFSMGGAASMLLAACLPERVTALAVIDAYPHPHQTVGSERIARWVSTSALASRRFDPAIARRFREMLEAGAALRADLRPIWQAIACPTLVVRGANSAVLPRETADEMLQAQPYARLETIAAIGHAIPEEAPAELAAILQGFAERTAGQVSLPH